MKTVFKVNEGRPNAVDLLKAGTLNLVIYTTTGATPSRRKKQSAAMRSPIGRPCITTMSGAERRSRPWRHAAAIRSACGACRNCTVRHNLGNFCVASATARAESISDGGRE